MFDVGFSELVVIGLVALLVLGPERLPRLARDAGRWVGQVRRTVNRFREEIDREVELGELRRLRDEIEARARLAAQEASAVASVDTPHAMVDPAPAVDAPPTGQAAAPAPPHTMP